jgi:hypothetical protein
MSESQKNMLKIAVIAVGAIAVTSYINSRYGIPLIGAYLPGSKV